MLLAILLAISLGVERATEAGGPWREVRYRGQTHFAPCQDSSGDGLRAESRAANSARVHRIESGVPLRISWRWRVLRHPRGADTSQKRSDDRAAAIFVLVKRNVLPWRTRGIVYQWSESGALEEWRPSPYAAGILVITLRAAPASPEWFKESRDLRADLLAALGTMPSRIEAIGILCDADDTGDISIAEFGDLAIEPSPGGQRP